MLKQDELLTKWKDILEHEDVPSIQDKHRRYVTAALLENTEQSFHNGEQAPGILSEAPTNSAGTGGYGGSASNPVAGYDPVLISLIRRAAPNLVAYDIAGVQPMTGPTGLIFAMRANYANQEGTEAFYDEANTDFAARNSAGDPASNTELMGGGQVGSNVSSNLETYNYAKAMETAFAEALGGSNTDNQFAEMAFSIDKVPVVARSRALKAEYSTELAQDLRAIHGLDAETELSNILQTEILSEINREVIRTINITATVGAQTGTTTAGTFDLDTDSNGRWSVEKFKGLMFFIEREANAIAKATRRGKGNIILCSSDVASALQMAGILDYTPALNQNNNLNVDDTGNTFAGILNGRYRVYIDPYAGSDYLTVGYKGASAFDAGLFYCPYVPLQMVRATGENSFQPKVGFKTRYGMVANPMSKGATRSDGSLEANANDYYRKALVQNLM